MELQSSDVFCLICYRVKIETIISLSICSKKLNTILTLPSFLKELSNYLGYPYNLSLLELYKYSKLNRLRKLDFNTKNKDMRMVIKLIEYEIVNYEEVMYSACKGGFEEAILLSQDLGAVNYHMGAIGASRRGHIDILKFMLNIGCVYCEKETYSECMIAASKGGHLDIVKLMLSYGARNYNKCSKCASARGYTEIVKLLLKWRKEEFINYNDCMFLAARNGHTDIVKIMLKRGATNFDEVFDLLSGDKGNKKLLSSILAYKKRYKKRKEHYFCKSPQIKVVIDKRCSFETERPRVEVVIDKRFPFEKERPRVEVVIDKSRK